MYAMCKYCDDAISAAELGDITKLRQNIQCRSNSRITCFNYACVSGHVDIVNFLIPLIKNYGLLNMGLIDACLNNHIQIIDILITNGASDIKQCYIIACYHGYVSIVQYFIKKHNMDVNVGLLAACSQGQIQVAKYLLECGANDFNGGLYEACYSFNGIKSHDIMHLNYINIIMLLSNQGGLLPYTIDEYQIKDLLNYGHTNFKSINSDVNDVASRCIRIRNTNINASNKVIDSEMISMNIELWDKNISGIISEYCVEF